MNSELIFRKANSTDLGEIWQIIQYAINSRKADGSTQWQNGYPNQQSISSDIEKGYAYVLTEKQSIMAYAAVIFEIEPEYEQIEGKWLTDQPYVVIHRIAVSIDAKGKGFATKILEHIEQLAISEEYYSVRVDTNFDNPAMLRIIEKLGYVYCGEVYFVGNARRAFEKILK